MRHVALITTALVLAACSETPQKSVYQHDQCHRLTLIDEGKDREVLGAEDIVRLPNSDLLVSAYDRRSKAQNGAPPEGGLYIVPKSALSKKTHTVSSLIKSMSSGLRPHGIDAIKLKDGTLRVAFVNRGLSKDARSLPSIVTFDLNGDRASKPIITQDAAFCRANDLAYNSGTSPPSLLVTHDRKHCKGLSAFYENMAAAKQGSIRPFGEGKPTADKMAFPNGIGIQFPDRPLSENNFMAAAETRANRISYFPKTAHRDWVALPGSPDNITIWKPGIILAALHPSLTRLALYRYKWPGFSRAPSRVVKVSGTQVLMLFDDPTGELYSAASVAVQTAGKLVLGSVGDSGLLVCDGSAQS